MLDEGEVVHPATNVAKECAGAATHDAQAATTTIPAGSNQGLSQGREFEREGERDGMICEFLVQSLGFQHVDQQATKKDVAAPSSKL